jgi:nucleotide-binding universal stress UspA family protein
MQRFKNILYLADGPEHHRHGLDRAVALARRNVARLTVIAVTQPVDIDWDLDRRYGLRLTETLAGRRLDELEVLTEPYADAGVMIYTQVLTGTPFIEAIRAVQRNGHDLLMKSAEGGAGRPSQALGSTDMHLLRKCPCPVWIDRPESAYPYRRLLAAVDPVQTQANPVDRLILDLATSLAEQEGARLEVVHAWHLRGEQVLRADPVGIDREEVETLVAETERRHREALNRLLAGYGMSTEDARVHLAKGEAAAIITARAEETGADLVLMGTLGQTGVPGLFIGDTAEEVLWATRTSVLAVKPPGFASPVTLP